MTSEKPPWNDEELVLQALLLADQINARCAARLAAEPAMLFTLTEVVPQLAKILLRSDHSARWPRATDMLAFLLAADFTLTDLAPHQSILRRLLPLIVEPLELQQREDDAGYVVRNVASLTPPPRVSQPWKLELPIYLLGRTKLQSAPWTTSPPPSASEPFIAVGRPDRYFWDFAINPLQAAHTAISRLTNSESDDETEHRTQRALRELFDLRKYRDEDKLGLRTWCVEYNLLFYNDHNPTPAEVRAARPATLSLSLLLSRLSKLSAAYSTASEAGHLRRAIGFYYFCLFTQLVRPRLAWSAAESNEGVETCLTALRKAEYPYLLNRIYGSLSNIPGLNFIFRGGIIPRTNRGRIFLLQGRPGAGKTVFALQKLCGIALRGGMGIYFSLEESHDLLANRIISFGFADSGRFRIEEAGDDLVSTIQSHDAETGGLIVFYSLKRGRRFSLPDVISSAAKASWTGWRALVLDSINALSFPETRDTLGVSPTLSPLRSTVQDLFRTIEEERFLGVVISEDYSAQSALRELPYLADTVVSFGYEPTGRSRWLEVEKCRSQNFHPGRHTVRIDDQGVSITPSLGAIRSALRRRIQATLSFERAIPLPSEAGGDLEAPEAHEKSTILFFGDPSVGKSEVALASALSASRALSGKSLPKARVRAVLVFTFRTTEARYWQFVRRHPALYGPWSTLSVNAVRWFSPGRNLSGAQVVWEIWKSIQRHRQSGVPIERIVIDEMEALEFNLPTLAQEPLFIPTLLQMLATEAVTSFLVFGRGEEALKDSYIGKVLRTEVDYAFRIKPGRQSPCLEPVEEPDATLNVEDSRQGDFGGDQ